MLKINLNNWFSKSYKKIFLLLIFYWCQYFLSFFSISLRIQDLSFYKQYLAIEKCFIYMLFWNKCTKLRHVGLRYHNDSLKLLMSVLFLHFHMTLVTKIVANYDWQSDNNSWKNAVYSYIFQRICKTKF